MSRTGWEIQLEAVPELQSKYEFLDRTQVQKIFDDILSTFFPGGDELKPHLLALSKQMNIVYAEPDEITEFLFALGIPPDEAVWLIWCWDREGISIKFRDFVQYYDELWYPSRDDVWMTDNIMSWLLHIDHEEFITFVRRH